MCPLISPLPILRGHKHGFELYCTEPVSFFSFHQTSQIVASVTEQQTMGAIEKLNKDTSVLCCVTRLSPQVGRDNGTRAACQYRACDLTVDSYKRMQSDNKNKPQCLQTPKILQNSNLQPQWDFFVFWLLQQHFIAVSKTSFKENKQVKLGLVLTFPINLTMKTFLFMCFLTFSSEIFLFFILALSASFQSASNVEITTPYGEEYRSQ